jgi:DNA-binding response OmpR family regulator
VVGARDGEEGLRVLDEEKPSLVVLDVMLPGLDGFGVCREIRRRSTVPVIMLSARGDAVDRIVGLELGADDYLPKPFEPRELVTRIQAVLRRVGPRPGVGTLAFDALTVRPDEREAFLDGVALGLSGMEFDLLLLLARHPGKKFTRDEIQSHLQGIEAGAYGRSIDVLVSRLRAKLGDDPKTPKYLKSVRGLGYVFLGAPE